MRQSIASLAVIRQSGGAQTLWLAQWNDKWQAYNFVGGHKHEDESFRECVVREVAEDLGLVAERDFGTGERLAHLEYVAWSESAQCETAYVIELFELTLLNDAARERLSRDPQNRWLAESEIHSRMGSNGRPVSATMPLLMTKARLWSDRTADGAGFPSQQSPDEKGQP